jgi:hypothetical protein
VQPWGALSPSAFEADLTRQSSSPPS